MELKPSPEPATDSVARMAFDPYITRRLFAFMPLRVLELPPQDRTWKALATFFSGLDELYELTGATNVTTWQVDSKISGYMTPYSLCASEVVGDVKVWKHINDHQLTYIRATHMVRMHFAWLSRGYFPVLTSGAVVFRQRHSCSRVISTSMAGG
jgi:hypothetical protein